MSRAPGFSLLEVMMATLLLAAGIALAFGAVRSASVATANAELEAAQAERLRAVQGFLRRQLESAMALPLEAPEPGVDPVVFDVSAERIRFVAPMPGYLSRGGPYVQEFRLRRGAAGMQLEFEFWLLTPEGPLEAEREPEVLLEGLAEAAFAVRGLAPDGAPTPWQDVWDGASQVPPLVRLQARFAAPRMRWPALVVAPRAASGGGYSPSPAGGDIDSSVELDSRGNPL